MRLKNWPTIVMLSMFVLFSCGEDPDQLYSKAETEAALGSQQRALDYLLRIQQTSPEYTDAYLFAARLFLEDGNLPEAVNQCKKGLDGGADSAMIIRYIGEIYHKNDNIENAYHYYRQALEINPSNTEVQVSMGNILHEKELFDQALQHFEKVLEQDQNNYEALVGKGKTLRELDKTELAIEVLNQAIKNEPMAGPAYGALAKTQEKTEVDKFTIQDNYVLSLKLEPKQPVVWKDYVAFSENNFGKKAAVDVLQEYLKYYPNRIGAFHQLARLYIDMATEESLSWLDASRKQCEQALLMDNDDHYSHALLAQIYLLKEKPRLALLEAQLAFEIEPKTEYRELVDRARFLLDQ